MAFADTVWYCNAGDQATTGYYAITKRPQNTAVVAGAIRRQFTAPAVGSERAFVCIVAGTTANVADATWTTTRGAKTTDGTVTWQECTGASAVNGDLTNTPTWTAAKAIGTPTLGAIIKRNNGASYQICSTAGTLGAAEPAFSDTAGVTTTETSATAVWTSLGSVANFAGGGAPHARLTNATTSTWWAAGNTVFVGDNHAESQAAVMTIAPAVSISTIGKLLCHNHSGSYPPAPADLTTGATISTTGGNALIINPTAGMIYFYGLIFQVNGQGLQLTPTDSQYYFDNCSLRQLGTAATNNDIIINSGSSNGAIIFNNTNVYFGNAANLMEMGTVDFIWQSTAPILAPGSAVPATLFMSLVGGRKSNVRLEALDLSQLTGTFFNDSGFAGGLNWLIKDCKLNSAMQVLNTSNTMRTFQFARCDS